MSNPVGRPPLWSDPKAFEESVEAYFDDKEKVHTWTGLALHLGFESRKSLWEYGEKPEFSNPVKKALLRIEEKYEQKLMGNAPTGSIFALKNFGWKDKTEVESHNVNYNIEPTEEEARKIKESLDKAI